MMLPQNQVHSLFGFSGCDDDEALVILQHLQPVLNVGCIVAEAVGGFKPHMVDQGRSSDFCDKFFLAVIIRTEEGGAV